MASGSETYRPRLLAADEGSCVCARQAEADRIQACDRHPAWLLRLQERFKEGLEPKIVELLLTNGRLTLSQVCFL